MMMVMVMMVMVMMVMVMMVMVMMVMVMMAMIQQFERRDDARRIPDITPGLFKGKSLG
jgi:hypothetical protein